MGTLTRGRFYTPTVNDTDDHPTGNVQPFSSQLVHDRVIFDAHLTFGSGVYQPANQTKYLGYVADATCGIVRSEFQDNLSQIQAGITKARALGFKFLWLPVPESGTAPTDQTTAETIRRVQWLAAHAADVTWGIEGLNEPNQNRGNQQTTPGWQNVAKAHQVAIWNTVQASPALAGCQVVGSSLNVRNFTTNIKLLGDTGIAAFMHKIGLHTYPGGQTPTTNLDERRRDIAAAFGPYDPATGKYGTTNPVGVCCTETGYTNSVANVGQHAPVSELASGIYAGQMLFEMCVFRQMEMGWYELLDDVDPGVKDVTESNFGLIGVSSTVANNTWRTKPQYDTLAAILTKLNDPGADYTPGKIDVDVTTNAADVKWTVTRKRGSGGVTTWWGYRAQSVYFTNTSGPGPRHDITVPTVPVTVTDSVGARTINVGAAVVSLDLR